MATKEALAAAYQAQGDAMGGCCDAAMGPVDAPCLELSGRRMQIGNAVQAWNALPAESPLYDPVIAGLEASTAQLAAANSEEECLAAVGGAWQALDALEALFD